MMKNGLTQNASSPLVPAFWGTGTLKMVHIQPDKAAWEMPCGSMIFSPPDSGLSHCTPLTGKKGAQGQDKAGLPIQLAKGGGCFSASSHVTDVLGASMQPLTHTKGQ